MKIAFGYKCGVGKDTAVDYLIQNHGGTRLSFASPIYDIMNYAQQVCGFPLQKDRKFLQMVGTDWARSIDPDVWVRTGLSRSKAIQGNQFISDLRFLNEFYNLKTNGWIVVKLVRERQEERKGSGRHEHQSEIELDQLSNSEWDYVIYNDGSLEDFYQQIRKLIETIKSKL